jgi:hypothetical protein
MKTQSFSPATFVIFSTFSALFPSCVSNEETLPEDHADAMVDSDAVPESDGSDLTAAPDCSPNDSTCDAPCLSRYVRRYSPELDCVAPNNSVRGSADLPFLFCDEPGAGAGMEMTCYCNHQGVCGATAELYWLPPDSDWEYCSDEVWEDVTSAYSGQQFCPPGTFD